MGTENQLVNPDTLILKACAHFQAAWDAEQAFMSSDHEIPDDVFDAVWSAYDAVKAFSPVTAEGMKEKARVGYQMAFTRRYRPEDKDWREGLDVYEVIAIEVLQDLAGAGGTPPIDEHPDRELIALAAEIVAMHDKMTTWNDNSDAASDQEWSEMLAAFWDAADRFPLMRAHSPEGLAAKARVLRAVFISLEGCDMNDRIQPHVLGLVSDMLGET